MVRAMSAPLSLDDLVAALPPRIWYLTSNGEDMWCRRPYGFWFSSGEVAEQFAAQVGAQVGSDHPLTAIGMDANDLIGQPTLDALRDLHVTRIFLDPRIDPESGDVFGTILRLGELH
jgi:hypothetical protein